VDKVDFEIVLKEEVYEEIFSLMGNIDKLNNGDEIGAWLLGEWNFEDNKGTLTLDEFVIPKQDVSGSEVDISPESMADTLKELGAEKCNRIKAHWHIHPFGNGSTNWSGTDEEKIKDFMLPEKGREIFVFLLSSEDRIKARVELNIKGVVCGKNINIKQSIDDIDVERLGQDNKTIFDKLKARIDEKVTRGSRYSDWKTQFNTKADAISKEEVYEDWKFDIKVDKKRNRINVHLDKEFAEFIEEGGYGSEDLLNPNKKKVRKHSEVWKYDIKGEGLTAVKESLTEEFAMLEEMFVDYIGFNSSYSDNNNLNVGCGYKLEGAEAGWQHY
jgi:hypothetical protein